MGFTSAGVTYPLSCALRAQAVDHLVHRAARKLEKPGELQVGPAAESFRDVSAYRIHRIVGLRSKLEITRECRPPRQLEHFDAHFVRQLPDDQIRVMARTAHATISRIRNASDYPRDSQESKGERAETASTAAATVRRNCTDEWKRDRTDKRRGIAPTNVRTDRTDQRSRDRTDER